MGIIAQVEQLAQLFSDIAAERCDFSCCPLVSSLLIDDHSFPSLFRCTLGIFSYALTLRLMIVNLRRKVGLATGNQTPVPQHADITSAGSNSHHVLDPSAFDGTQPLPPITLQDLDFSWPSDMLFSPANIPTWLHEAVSSNLDFLSYWPLGQQ